MQVGEPLGILQAASSLGFAHYSEDILETNIEVTLKAKLPEVAVAAGDYKTELALTAMRKIYPKWSKKEVHVALSRAHLAEHPELRGDLPCDVEILSSAVAPMEVKDVKNYVSRVEDVAKKQLSAYAARTERIARFFPAPKPKAKAKAKAKARPRFPMVPSADTPQATAFLEQHMPETVVVLEDHYNGRYRVVSTCTGTWKSISWTRRGWGKTVAEVLHQAWTYHCIETGQGPPFDIDELLIDFLNEED